MALGVARVKLRFHQSLVRDGIAVSTDDVDTWVNLDDPAPTAEEATTEQIVASVCGESSDEDDAQADEPDAELAGNSTVQLPTAADAVKGMETALMWLETKEVDCVKLMQLRNILSFARRAQFEGTKKQCKLTDYFKKAAGN